MTLDEFWEHIHATKCDDPEEHAVRLVERLVALPPDDSADFEHLWWALKNQAVHMNLRGAAYVIGGGLSDDGFSDFRSWLVLQGRAVFEAALADPDSLAGAVIRRGGRCECYPGSTAWFRATGTPTDNRGYDLFRKATEARKALHPQFPKPEVGQRWNFDDEDEVRKRLPRLAARYLDD
jgi:hypothetical protein